MTGCDEGKKWENLQMLGQSMQLFFTKRFFKYRLYAWGEKAIFP